MKKYDYLNVCGCKVCGMFFEHVNFLRLKEKSNLNRELFNHAHTFPNFCPWCGAKILKITEIIARQI